MQVNARPIEQEGLQPSQQAAMLGQAYDGKNIAIDSQLLQSHQDEQAQALAVAAQQQTDRSTEYAIQQLQGYPGLKPDPHSHHPGALQHHDPNNQGGVPHGLGPVGTGYAPGPAATPKPMVGSEEYYRVKKYNHKEVERRRRETINKGIDDLGKVVPDCDKHKGQILAKAVNYITMLKEKEETMVKQLTLEKLISEQSISELSAANKSLKAELAQAWKELEHYKRRSKGMNE